MKAAGCSRLMRGSRYGIVAVLLLRASVALAVPPPPPPPLPVSQHVLAVYAHAAGTRAYDHTGRIALSEARTSAASARDEFERGNLKDADQLAASADDLLRAVELQPRVPPRSAARILGDVSVLTSIFSRVRVPRVHTVLALANEVAMQARRRAIFDDASAAVVAVRAEAIARAAAHIAIAGDPSLDRLMPAPPPPPRMAR